MFRIPFLPDWVYNITPDGRRYARNCEIAHTFTGRIIKARQEELVCHHNTLDIYIILKVSLPIINIRLFDCMYLLNKIKESPFELQVFHRQLSYMIKSTVFINKSAKG